jgi:hypothetical protein
MKNSRPKYKNTKCEYEGIKFDSRREMDRYIVLKDAERKGLISGLEVHKKYELLPAVKDVIVEQLKTKVREKTVTLQHPITYTCDFYYIKDGKEVCEDVKISEFLLPKEYVLKEKMMFYFFRIKIKRVYKPTESV